MLFFLDDSEVEIIMLEQFSLIQLHTLDGDEVLKVFGGVKWHGLGQVV